MAKKIFIIEDDENILYGLQDRFSSDGLEVELSDGSEELEDIVAKIKKSHPDFVVLDFILPKLDGAEIIRRIKTDPEISDIQVLIFTDLSDEDSKARSVGLGANYYFLKSELDVFQFSDKVKKIIEGKSGAEEDDDDDVVLDQ